MLKVLKSGFYTTIQDTGRFGFRTYGVPVSGAMDSYSAQFANVILGNAMHSAVLEITMTGPTLKFLQPTVIAISGANMKPKLNESLIDMNLSISIKTNDILSFGKLENGFRTYLAIKNGFLTTSVLGSRSMYSAVTNASRILNNDMLEYHSFNSTPLRPNATVVYDKSILESQLLFAYKGPEFSRLHRESQDQLLESTFTVSKFHSRMAYQLEPILKNDLDPILTAPVLPGTVQLTPAGNLIVLMRDCQTTGGYPRVLQLTEKAISVLSQKTTGNTFKFRLKE